MKKIAPVLLGNMLEAYDFCLYGLLAPLFAKIFFPENFQHSLIAAFLLFSIAYISRPFGSILWGHIADKYGRKPVLMGTLTMMAIPAVAMACMPTYESIGVTVCFVIVFLRLMQGISFGGEFPTIMVTLYELAPKNRKGLFGSFTDGFAIIGYLTGLSIVILLKFLLSEVQMQTWGWRLMFGMSIIFIALVGYIRFNLLETLPKTKKEDFPILVTMKKNWQSIIKIVLYMFAPCCLFFNFVFYTYLLIQTKTELSEFQVFIIQASIIIYSIILIPLMGYISDKVGRFKLVKLSSILLLIFCIPIYQLFLTGNILLVIFSYLIFGVFVAISIGTFVPIIIDQSSENCRVTTIGLSHSLAVLFGSFTPTINEFLIYQLNTNIAPAFYIMLCVLVSLFCLSKMKNIQVF